MTSYWQKIAVVLAAAILLAAAGCSSLPPAVTGLLGLQTAAVQCGDIVLGVLIGEEDDPIAREQRDGYELALQQVNASGGVAGCDLQLRYAVEAADGDSRQTYLAVRALVEEERVIAFLGASSNPGSMYAASLANYFSLPMLAPSASGDHILPQENLWAFRLNAGEAAYAGLAFSMLAEQLGPGARAAVIYEDSTFGNDAALAAVNAIQQSELQVAGYHAFDAARSTYPALVEDLFGAQAQVVYLAFSSPQQAAAVLAGLQKEGLPPGLLLVARAGGFASQDGLLAAQEDQAEAGEPAALPQNLLLVTRWTEENATGDDDPFPQAYARYAEETYGSAAPPSQYTAEAYKSLLIAASALESALKNEAGFQQDTQQLREAMRQELFNYKENSPLWGAIDFSSSGQNPADLVVLQVMDGSWQVIYPPDRAEADPTGDLTTE